MERHYVERRDGGFYLVGSRVPLDCIVREYWEAEAPEAIRSHYPTLSMEQVYGAITFYLGNQEDVEMAMRERERVEDAFAQGHPAPAHLRLKLEHSRQRSR